MNEQDTSRFGLSGDEQRIGQYVHFNFLAVVALLLGLASATALTSPFLWVVPLIALGVAIPALMMSYREDMGGRIPAVLSIVLALFFGSFAISHYCFGRCVIYSEAQAVGQNWLKLVVAGNKNTAHQAMLNVANRLGSGIPLKKFYEMDEEAAKERDKRFELSPAADLLDYGEDAEIQLVKNVTQQFDEAAGLGFIQQVYRITAADKEPIEAKVSITQRDNKSISSTTWIVGDCEPNNEPKANVFEVISSLVTKIISSSKS